MKTNLKYHHLGIPVKEPQTGEVYLKDYKAYHVGFETSEFGIELMRYDDDCPLPEIVRTKPHVAFEVDDIFEARYAKLTPSGRMLSESDLIGPLDFLVSESCKAINGQTIQADGGWTLW